MLPTEPSLSLHRLVAPVPPARAQDAATAARQGAPVVAVPVAVSNAQTAHAAPALAQTPPTAAQDQLGNAAITKAATQAPQAAPLLILPSKSGSQ
ncbi:hypothetical protein ACFRNT_14655 [Streptomyces sp. NPDC056697]|uniref:hypothetical protein n=1 Tax=Streptomyces sp. NPDC056697 TaxID=3345915 RepID=UPI00369FF172